MKKISVHHWSEHIYIFFYLGLIVMCVVLLFLLKDRVSQSQTLPRKTFFIEKMALRINTIIGPSQNVFHNKWNQLITTKVSYVTIP